MVFLFDYKKLKIVNCPQESKNPRSRISKVPKLPKSPKTEVYKAGEKPEGEQNEFKLPRFTLRLSSCYL